jgi:hypothetical protein
MAATRDLVFDRVTVDNLVRGGTGVTWSVFYQFREPGPWSFQLQVGSTGDPDADDWADVGAPVENAFTAVDSARRAHGVLPKTHYRVVLTTAAGAHRSAPAWVFGQLPHREWIAAREIIRKERRILARKYAGARGLLLKRRTSGPGLSEQAANDPRTMVVDPISGDIIKRHAAVATMGTPFLKGYYKPVPFEVIFDPGATNPTADDGQLGNVDQAGLARSGRVVMFPQVTRGDVFIETATDARYAFQDVKIVADLRGVPILAQAKLHRFELDDVIYSLDPATL